MPVLTCVEGIHHAIVLVRRVDHTDEDYGPFEYWDDPTHEPPDMEHTVYAWQSLPELPKADLHENLRQGKQQ